ncbi:MAG: O-antigen ligase family protein [Phycisphaerales bacterium]|nr:MAG: O-antigen ligase family protein [Phycisphaerales bacterium]
MWPLKTTLYFVLFWGACLMALVNPIWGVLNYMMTYQVHPKWTWWGAPLAALGMRFSLLAATFTIVGLLTGRKHVPQVRPFVSLWEVGVLILVASGALNLVIGHGYNSDSAYAFEKVWKMLLFVLILGRLATTRANLRLVIWTLVAGSLYVGYDAFTSPASAFYLGRLELVGGPDFSTTSGLAAHLAAVLPIIGAAFLTARRWRWRIFAVVAGALSVNTIILCRTRSAFIGLVAGVLTAVLMAPRARRYRIHCLLIGGAVIAFALTDDHFWNRMGTLTDREALAQDTATVGRSEIWLLSLRVLADNPQGVGPGNFPRVIGSYNPRYYKRSSHNTLLVCFTEFGIHGGIVFLLMVAGSLRFLFLSTRLADGTNHPTQTKLLAYGFLVAFVTYFVTGLGTERFYCESYWWILVLPLCLYRVVVREATADVEVPKLAEIPYLGKKDAVFGGLQYEPG